MKKYLLLFLTITMIIAITTKVKAQVNTQDSLALVDLYNSTGGINWSNNTNWLTIAPVSSWYGVTVSSGRVTKINFNLNQLTGSIPTSIGNLSKLTALILRFEQLSGSIPSSLGNLRNLISLDLGNNQLSGVIPSFLGNLTSLQSLSLSGNQFSSGSIPSSFANLTNLTSLVLVGDSLTGSIPSFLGNLTNLNNPNSYLELSGNQLSGSIPSSLGNLTNIRYLWLANNQLSGAIPSSFENHVSDLPGIQFNLWLSGNQFTFAGMEGLSKFSAVQYAPQATIPLNANNNVLSVSAGGTPSNNTYKWYEDSVLIATKVGDSTYTITSSGRYFVNVTNSVATQLTLASTTFITPPTLTSFTPTIAMTGTTDTIRGSGFTGATAVSFGGVAAKYFTILNDSTITAVVNNGASGDINITTAGGTGSLAGFIYCVPNSSITNANICYKGTYIFNNKSYTTAGIYKATLTNSLECDSIATLVLTVGNAPVTKITNYHSCQSFIYNGITYQNSTTVIDTIKNYQGCDSIYNVANININPIVPTSNYIPLNSCNQLTYAGKTYYQSTVATDTTKSYQGCDSIYNVLLITINKILPVTNISYLSSCNSLYFNGKIYTGSTNVIDTIRSYQGCDSIYNVTKISINKIIPKSTSNSITGCNSVAYKGNTYFSTSFVKDTIRSYQGCDSIYNTTLIVINKITPVTQSTNLSGCSSVIYNSKEYFSSDVIHDTIRSYQGCDSIYKVVTITVTPIVAVAKSIQYSGCNSVVYHGKTYTVSTIVKDTVRSYQGCDSIYNTATITITPITPVIKPVQFSGCNSVVYHGKTYTSSTIIKDTIRSYQGCDSIYDVATITIKPITPFTKSIKYSGCNSVVYNGKTYTISTVIRDTVRSYQGCDSIYNLTTITITPITPVIKPVEYSGCNSVVYHGTTFTASTIVRDTVKSYQGCDSIYNIATITVNPLPAVSINGNTTLKNDTTLLTAIVNNANNSGLVRYIKYTSTYSDDNGQVDVYEIQAYKNGVNLALNKSGYANSYGPGGGTWNNNGYMVDDGVNGTRWSSDRRNPGHASTTTPIYIQIDLQQVYSIDSILLNIAGFDNHKETFTMQVSTDTINWTTIGAATDTTGTFIYSLASNSVLWSTGSTNQSIIVDSAGIYSVKVTDINGCSNTAFDTIRKVLPVTISSFTATDHNKTIETEWQTATELNTSHFIIQHRTDGTSFAEIGNVKAVGSGANKYQFEDSKPNTGINYYRLESVDMDGTTTYSKVVSVEYANAVNHLTIYPNPVKNILTISGEHITRVQILDNMGRIVNTQFLHDAINPSLSVSNLPIGIYHVRIQTTDNKTNTIGFVKQ